MTDLLPIFDPLLAGVNMTGSIPDVMEFVLSPDYLNRPNLYPRQGTLLKLLFCQEELFCADEETEILTKRGWQRYDSVEVGEDVMTIHPETWQAEWQPALRVNIFPVDGVELVSREGQGHSSLTTPDHRWPVERFMQDGYNPRWERGIRLTSELSSRDRIPCAAPVVNLPDSPQWSDALVELVGWYWTEGHRITGHNGVKIIQSLRVNPSYCDRIRRALTDLFGPASDWLVNVDKAAWSEAESDGHAIFRLNELASTDLKWVAEGDEKVIRPEFLCSLTSEQLNLLIDVSIMADGWVHHGGTRIISQASKSRMDAFQMACSMAGIRSVLREKVKGGSGKYAGRTFWQLTLQERRPHASMQRQVVEVVEHTGVVWCPTTPNGTWLARRNGKVFFTGNTDYDYEVIAEWSEGFVIPPEDRRKPGEPIHYEGNNGVAPDVLERMRLMRSQGRGWFREVLPAIGRRGGKGYIGGLAGSYVIWYYHQLSDPQGYYGVARDKRLGMYVFAGKREQAKANQWRDIVNVILGAPCFTKYISRSQGELLSIKAPHDSQRMKDYLDREIKSEMDPASFEIVPKESTLMAGRGPALFCLDPSTPVLKSDLTWVPIGELQAGDRVIGLDEFPEAKGKHRRLRDAEVVGVRRTVQPALELTFDDGSSVVCSKDHRWLKRDQGKGGSYLWRPASSLKVGNSIRAVVDPWVSDESYDAGYLRGFFDGEGCVNKDSGDILYSQNPGPVLDYVHSLLEEKGFSPQPAGQGAYPSTPEDRECEQWALRGLADCLRFLGQVSPIRLRGKDQLVWEGRSLRGGHTATGRFKTAAYKTIVSIQELPEQELVDIETTTRTFIANGLVSHNCIFFDEMAHVVASGANRSAEEVWGAATPALDQFAKDAFIYCGSSTWQMMGQFYEECQQALELDLDPETGEFTAVYPEKLFIQLTSWDIYKDWERAHEIPLVPDEYAEACFLGLTHDVRGKALLERKPRNSFFYDQISGDIRCYPRIKRPIQTYDDEMRKLERANPETFRVERRSYWATALNAYLNPTFVDRMWSSWSLLKGEEPRILTQQTRGLLNRTYIAHGDPSKSGANFGWAIAHTEGPDENGLTHVVFDVINAWKPSDFEEGYIDYIKVMEDLCQYIDDFVPSSVSFDQFNSAPLMAQLRQHIGKRNYPRRVDVFERTATRQVNWAMAEAFKTALGLNLIHAPFFELADQELKFLQDLGGRIDHPTSGPIQTKDVADAMMNVVWGCIGEQMAAFIKDLLSSSEVRMALPAFDSSPSGTESRDQQIKDGLAAFGRARGIRPMPPRGTGERGFNPTPKRPTT